MNIEADKVKSLIDRDIVLEVVLEHAVIAFKKGASALLHSKYDEILNEWAQAEVAQGKVYKDYALPKEQIEAFASFANYLCSRIIK